ncbi:MAG TPA: T9SS type A sorting domain-containing protein [Flavobacterium sp.]|jgi:uncharacterized repeat protein (TIGR01451 family)
MKKLFLLIVLCASPFAKAQFFETFDDMSYNLQIGTTWPLPSGTWHIFNNGVGTQQWTFNPPAPTFQSFSPTRAAYIDRQNIGNGNQSRHYLATPLVTVPPDAELRFRSRSTLAGDQGTFYQIWAAPEGADPLLPASYTILLAEFTENDITTAYTQTVLPLDFPSGTSLHLAFVRSFTQQGASLSGDRWLVDDIQVSAVGTSSLSCFAENVTLVGSTSTEATISWTTYGSTSESQIIALPCSAPTPTSSSAWIPAVSPATIEGLDPTACYNFYVRNICNGITSAPSFPVKKYPAPAQCNGAYYDTGGPTWNYSNNENSIYTICPTVAGEYVSVTFTAFDTEANWDALYVFNGNSTAAPQITSSNGSGNVPGGITGGYWGNDIPGPFFSSSPDGCLTFWFRSDSVENGPGWAANVECSFQITDTITLVAFIDQNANGVKDSDEVAFTQGNFSYQINNVDTTINVYTISGDHIIPVLNNGNTYDLSYQIFPELSDFYDVAVSAVYDDILISPGTGNQIFYFPINSIPHNDVTVGLSSLSGPQPGQVYIYNISYSNNGTSSTSGTLSFTKDEMLTITNVSEAGITSTPAGFTYNFTALQPFEQRNISVTMLVPALPTVTLGQIVTNSVSISGPADDVNIENNESLLSGTVAGSYDPNDIMESHGEQIVFSTFSPDDYLYYRIRFQNTGNADASTVRVEDALDPQLDPESVRMISSSHDYILTRIGDQLTWQFDNIGLPPQSEDDAGSNGYILYKVKLDPGFAVGDIIPNTAHIFFDINPAIVTNTFNTEFVTMLANPTFADSNMIMYPNPASRTLNISIRNAYDPISLVTIHDMVGKKIKTLDFDSTDAVIDLSGLQKGLYTVQIETQQNNVRVKKLIIN